ncbi:MAG: glucose-1-phosphate thymidylyltransferase [Spirochaetia bacterium]|nr:glucose-1-phosphate thymidylyltransferase [Spirochaetia bacterium]
MSNVIRLIETEAAHARPLLRLRSSFSLRDGIYTRLERLRLKHPDAQFLYTHSDPEQERWIAEDENMISARAYATGAASSDSPDHESVHAPDPLTMLDDVGTRLASDMSSLRLADWGGVRPEFHCVGPAKDLLIHPSAVILPGVVMDTREGPVVIDAGAQISSFSYLQGPLYIGRECRIDDARITGGSIIGQGSRIGGEVENSIIQDFTNKHHEGFVGHTIAGSWVNLGALTTTSDLKNNYGEIRLKAPAQFLPNLKTPQVETTQTGRIKLGSMIADCVKTAIGTMITTGSVLDTGANVFGGAPSVYVPPLAWGVTGGLYEPERFVADSVKIFGRRGRRPSANFQALIFRLAASRT